MSGMVKDFVKSAVKEKAKEKIQEKVSELVTDQVQAHGGTPAVPTPVQARQSPGRPVPSGNSYSASHIGRGINSMNSMRPHSDLILHVGPSKKSFHVHKAILIKSSRFFENIISPPSSRSSAVSSSAPTSSNSASNTTSVSSGTTVTSTTATTRSSSHRHHHHRRTIVITDLDASVFPLILEFFYSDHFPQQATLLEIAKMYDQSTTSFLDAKRLKSKCVKHFVRAISEGKFCIKPTPLEEFAGGVTATSAVEAVGDKKRDSKKGKGKGKEKEKVGFAKDAEEAVTKYAEELVELCDACIILFQAYEKKDKKYLWKILDALREQHMLKAVMGTRKVKKALMGKSEVSSAILEFYSKKD